MYEGKYLPSRVDLFAGMIYEVHSFQDRLTYYAAGERSILCNRYTPNGGALLERGIMNGNPVHRSACSTAEDLR